jgi:hypothetical protein
MNRYTNNYEVTYRLGKASLGSITVLICLDNTSGRDTAQAIVEGFSIDVVVEKIEQYDRFVLIP